MWELTVMAGFKCLEWSLVQKIGCFKKGSLFATSFNIMHRIVELGVQDVPTLRNPVVIYALNVANI
jgi:hypothetical protein